MSKKRYTLYLSRPLARKFDLVAKQRQGAKSALVEEALRVSLEPEQHPGIEDGLARRLNDLNKAVTTIGRDVAIATETLALFVRYFLTITPPLPQSEQEPARLLGRERFEVFVAQVGRRLAGDHRLVSEVLETIATDQPDLFATASDDAPLKNRPERRSSVLGDTPRRNGQDPNASRGGGNHG
ncbi:MAG: CopG family transcriptional regulator [Hyphomonadaceae bacterium]|jgi:hypothetical protein|nr:CopG family transcriptional regulator [Hyphomonadaceae bacterium]